MTFAGLALKTMTQVALWRARCFLGIRAQVEQSLAGSEVNEHVQDQNASNEASSPFNHCLRDDST